MNRFLVPKDVAKQFGDAENVVDKAAKDRLKAKREASKERCGDLIAKWGLPQERSMRIGRPSYQPT